MTENNQFENQRRYIEEAFLLFLKLSSPNFLDLFFSNNLSSINSRLKTINGQDSSLFDIETTAILDKVIEGLKESGLYDSLTHIESDEGELLDYTKLLDAYYQFLISYHFAKVWSLPRELSLDKNDVFQNTIVYGAPGTGKSHFINELSKKNKAEIIRTTFHPDMDYSSFVGCFKPFKESNGEMTYQFVPQAFTRAYVKAWQLPSDVPFYLIIEEINRGNCSQIFGDLFQLLDRDKKGESKYGVTPNTDLADFLRKEFENNYNQNIPEKVKNADELRLPSNLWILATMNTSDQSLYPMDSAFKRRWEWKYIPLERGIPDKFIQVGNSFYSWGTFLLKINAKIAEATQSEDKKLGFWFIQADDKIISSETFVNKVLFYLWNDIYKDRLYDDRSPFNENGQKFHSFYTSQDKLNENAIKSFLNTLDVHEEDDIQSFLFDDESEPKEGGGKFRVLMDGQLYDNKKAVDVYAKVIETIGIKRIKKISDEKYNGKWVITKEEYNNVNTDKRRYRETSDGTYLHVGLSNVGKQSRLETIRDELGLDMTIELQ